MECVKIIAFLLMVAHLATLSQSENDSHLLPTVMIVMTVRNKAHVLPHTLALLEELDYPKNRISIWIRSDHNEDATEIILNIWSKKWKNLIAKSHGSEDVYHHLDIQTDGKVGARHLGQDKSPVQWSQMRFEHIMKLREQGLAAARKAWADWVWQLDADVFLTNPNILKSLLFKNNSTVIAPILGSLGLYSNFWAGMSDQYYYVRTSDYESIVNRKKGHIGCRTVPMVHSSVLINLRHVQSKHLTYTPDRLADYDGPFDDIITFAISASWNGISMTACNDQVYGFLMMPQDDSSRLSDDLLNLSNLKLIMLAYMPNLPAIDELSSFVQPAPKKDSLGVDNIYMINLERRPDRKRKMDNCFNELGIKYEWIKAVDGKKDINLDYIAERGIKMMPEFEEPYHGRPVTYGEIGCFMSHYTVWNDVIDKNYSQVIVFEDDVKFEPFFRSKMQYLQVEIKRLKLDWDLIFLGRKVLPNSVEPWVENSDSLVHVNYTYWTLGYMLNHRGARKLVAENPLSKIVPVDEYLPILYDKHPKESWKAYFKNRTLKAYSVAPLFIFPTHYTGDEGYLSDTDDSEVMSEHCAGTNSKCIPVKKDEL